MTTKYKQALKDLEATCEDLADLDEAFNRGRLQGLEEAARAICEYCKHGSQADYYPNRLFGWYHAIGSGDISCKAAAIREISRDAAAPKSRSTGISLDGGKTIHSKFKND